MTTKKKSEGHRELETISVLAGFLLLLNLSLHRPVLVNSALALLFIGLFVRPVSRIISRGWLIFAERLGAINSKIILTMVFFLFITPIAFLYRLFSKNPLQIKRENHLTTLYLERNHLCDRADFEKMW